MNMLHMLHILVFTVAVVCNTSFSLSTAALSTCKKSTPIHKCISRRPLLPQTKSSANSIAGLLPATALHSRRNSLSSALSSPLFHPSDRLRDNEPPPSWLKESFESASLADVQESLQTPIVSIANPIVSLDDQDASVASNPVLQDILHRAKIGFYFGLWYALNVAYNGM